VWCVVCGVWCVVCGVWCVVCGVWCVCSCSCPRSHGQHHHRRSLPILFFRQAVAERYSSITCTCAPSCNADGDYVRICFFCCCGCQSFAVCVILVIAAGEEENLDGPRAKNCLSQVPSQTTQPTTTPFPQHFLPSDPRSLSRRPSRCQPQQFPHRCRLGLKVSPLLHLQPRLHVASLHIPCLSLLPFLIITPLPLIPVTAPAVLLRSCSLQPNTTYRVTFSNTLLLLSRHSFAGFQGAVPRPPHCARPHGQWQRLQKPVRRELFFSCGVVVMPRAGTGGS
jgi:hypothetical protein